VNSVKTQKNMYFSGFSVVIENSNFFAPKNQNGIAPGTAGGGLLLKEPSTARKLLVVEGLICFICL
jgi:hypothetical protein